MTAFPALLLLPALLAAPADDGSVFDQRAAAALSRVDFESAAEAWEALAEAAPRAPRAPEALAEAALLRLALDQVAEADADTRLLRRSFASARPDLAAHVVLARVRRDEDAARWEDARVMLSGAMPWFDQHEPIEARAEAHTIHARLLSRLDHERDAGREQRRVIALAALPGVRAKRWSAGGRDALAEAHFALAEEKREAARKFVLAPYLGKGDRDSVLAYHHDKVEPWLRRKRYLVELAQSAYEHVLGRFSPPPEPPPPPPPPVPPGSIGLLGGDPNASIAPWGRDPIAVDGMSDVPSPRWAVATAARVGALWNDLRHEVAMLPVPREQRNADWRNVWDSYQMSIIETPAEELRQLAKAAFVYGLEIATRYHIESDEARACLSWLERNQAAEHRDSDALRREELYPSPIPSGTPAPLPQAAGGASRARSAESVSRM